MSGPYLLRCGMCGGDLETEPIPVCNAHLWPCPYCRMMPGGNALEDRAGGLGLQAVLRRIATALELRRV
jgi:hypothetical protein